MSILDRLNMLVRSNLNDLGPRHGASWQGTLREMNGSLRDAERQLIVLRRGERQLAEELRSKRQKIDQWEDRAMMALQSGDEDLAREAIVVKNQAMREAEAVRDKLEDHRRAMRDLESSLEALRVKLEGARQRGHNARSRSLSEGSARRGALREEGSWDAELRRRLASRQESPSSSPPRAEAGGTRKGAPRDERSSSRRDEGLATPSRPYLDPSPFDIDGSLETMDRMARSIAAMEARVDADMELSGEDDDLLVDPKRRRLDRVFENMERTKRTDQGLSELKRKFSDDD